MYSEILKPPFEEWNPETTKPIYDVLVNKYDIDPFELWTFIMNEMPLSEHSFIFQTALKKEFPEWWEYSNGCEILGFSR